jgi:uncharacterized protein (TIGR02757 family)
MQLNELKDFLDEKVEKYNNKTFIDSDPIQIPHQFTKREDIEIAGFLTATIAWGNRKMIIKNGQNMMQLMDNSPFEFVKSHSEKDLQALQSFVHRTFNGTDFICFIRNLKNIYKENDSLEQLFISNKNDDFNQTDISNFKKAFFETTSPERTFKHISDPINGSAAKRINMFLRWMVRGDKKGVDFGIWKNIPMSRLSCPLDVHSGNVARKLGLLDRKQNDSKSVFLLDENLRTLDINDPVKYDFALFGLGIFEGF